jgi:hypothetical protein
MTNSHPPAFLHRRNRDGSFDSVCCECAATAASAATEADLASGERRHACDRYLLETRRRLMSQRLPGRSGISPPES